MTQITEERALFNALVDASALLDAEGRIVAVNDKWRRFAEQNGGDGQADFVGQNYLGICHRAEAEGAVGASTVMKGLTRVLRGEAREFRAEYPCHSPTERRWFEFVASAVAESGACLVTHRDISARTLQMEELEQSKLIGSELAAIVATSPDGILAYDLDGLIRSWNGGASALYGYDADEIIGRSIELLYPEDWPTRITEYRDRIISGELSVFEAVRCTKDGEARHVSISAAPVRNAQGEVAYISNVHRDIGDRVAAEEKLKFISGEMNHRVKNIVSVISAIVNLTLRGASDFGEFRAKFQSRLQSLMRTNDMLVNQSWAPVSLDSLVKSQLGIFSLDDNRNVTVEGPDIELQPEAVEVLGLALHELLTNAIKHGALSGRNSAVRFGWHVVDAGRGSRLELHWREQGVDIAQQPEKKGFGHSVLVNNVKRTLDAEVDLRFESDGLSWRVLVPGNYFTHR